MHEIAVHTGEERDRERERERALNVSYRKYQKHIEKLNIMKVQGKLKSSFKGFMRLCK